MVDINKIEQMAEQIAKRRAQKVAQFFEMLRDPDLAPEVALLLNGHHPQQKQSQFKPPVGFKTGHGIREAVRALTLPSEFNVEDVVRGLEATNFRFASEARKEHSVRDALRALAKEKVVRVKKHGKGGKPGVYERVAQQ